MPFYQRADMERIGVSFDEHRPAVRGERMEVGYYCYPPRTRKPAHRHAEEQIVTVIKGKLAYRVDHESRVLGPGDSVYIPANVDHENWSLDEEVEFVSCKDIPPT